MQQSSSIKYLLRLRPQKRRLPITHLGNSEESGFAVVFPRSTISPVRCIRGLDTVRKAIGAVARFSVDDSGDSYVPDLNGKIIPKLLTDSVLVYYSHRLVKSLRPEK